MPAPTRLRADACPGVVATHDAADGALARVRLPGGALTGAQAGVVAGCAAELGDGAIHLTSRANLQLRAVRDTGELVARLSGAGLLPAPGHERVRNILGSPASGLSGGLTDIRPLVRGLDRALCARPELAALPGRFLFALDDGRGDVAGEGADVCWQAVDGDEGALLLDGSDTGLRVPARHAVAALLEAAAAFGRTRGSAWRVREAYPAPLVAAARRFARETHPVALPLSGPLPVGPLRGGAVVAAPVLGHVPAAVLARLARCGELIVTPWRTLVLPDGGAAEGTGLVTDRDAPSLGVSACIGRPGCAKARADVRADALAAMAPDVRAHFSGCERRCGRPRGPHHDVVAADDGYRVDGLLVSPSELASALRGRPAKGQQ
ncbi:precorrin-3B synthase [Prauserella muralis]|uniref:Precorrin-3B synthase n=1 Tax=Prauserella muralis TaxID=588067 RepID=A0A2V4B1G3_9PSEU|nr:precorrin-3B synthase [Prauserella muralis]PXY26985.1 precorrin-3B synthase [Prauserella muralis]TWE23398.1 precorrin-3B synthase [Prauserella muralis]